MKKLSLLFVIILFAFNSANSQKLLSGIVYDGSSKKDRVTLVGANVYWQENLSGVSTNEKGEFELPVTVELPSTLIISFVGFHNDSILINPSTNSLKITLEPSVSIEEVKVEAKRNSTEISTLKPQNVEELGTGELLKAACCNLSESFETNPSVNVAYTDAITGAKDIQMLGLSGIYSQIMTENIPNLKGLAAPYGLAYVPGPWMESIQITKGSGSVANGFESTTGQINIEFIKPEKADPFYLNLYGSDRGRFEINAHQLIPASDKLKGMLFVHGESMQNKMDRQNDGFLDQPLVNQANVYNRWQYHSGKNFEGQFGIKYLTEERNGGQVDFNKGSDLGTKNHYGVGVKTQRIELYSKTGLVFPETPWKSAGLILNASLHDMNSYFGLKTYDADQKSMYGSLIYMTIIGSTNHKIKSGIDFRYDHFNETYNLANQKREQIVPGGYIEYTLSDVGNLGVVAGIRADHLNNYGTTVNPRLHIKYNLKPEIIFRASAGRSLRTANVYAENISAMATSREFFFKESLNPEIAWNYGLNATARFRLDYREGSVSVDYYSTQFQNQVVVDMYSSKTQVGIYNLSGKSYSNSFQVALNYELLKRLDIRLAWKMDDVVTTYGLETINKPLVPKYRALFNVAYATKGENWIFDLTLQYEGEKKLGLADSELISDSQVTNGSTPEFLIVNSQITRKWNRWQFYAGCENVFDFVQKNVIIGAQDPFGPEFDATNIWGPVVGRNIYLGLRYTINKK